MRFFSALSAIAVLSAFSAANGFATSSTYDNTYDNPNGSLFNVACSNGANGLITKGFTDFASLPNFPFIGGAQAVSGWNSPQCGSCWALTYQGKTIYVTAIDTAANGFNIAQEALDNLTGGKAVALGRVNVDAEEVAGSYCGF